MIEIFPTRNSKFVSNDKVLTDIVRTHISYMQEFSKDDETAYSVVIPESIDDIRSISFEDADSVNITQNYFEVTFISDNSVKVVIVKESMATNAILSKIDMFS